MTTDGETPNSRWKYVLSLERLGEGELAEDQWGIRELYERDGKLGWSADTVRAQGSTWMELMDDMSRMDTAAASNEVLDLTMDPPQLRARRQRRRP